MAKRLLMISTDRKIFEPNSPVRARQIEYAKQFDEVNIIVFAGKEFHEQSIGNNVFVYPTRSVSKWTYPFAAMSLGHFIIDKRGINQITCQDPFLTAMAGVSLKKKHKVPLEIQIHTDIGSQNFGYTLGNRIRKFLALNYLPQADTVRVVSERVKDYLVHHLLLDSAKIFVKPIAVNTDWIRNAPIIVDLHQKYSQFEKIILMASRLEKEKNFSLALQAFQKVLTTKKGVGLIIVGEGSEKKVILKTANQLGISNNVILEPWASKDILASYYKTADLFLNTSLYEGYGMTLVEAKAAGTKIVSTDVGVAMEVGANIASYSPEDLAAKILFILK